MFVESRSKLHQPLGVHGGDLPHVLLGGLHHLVEHNPLGLPVEQTGARMDGHDLTVHQGPVALLRILLSCVPKGGWKGGLYSQIHKKLKYKSENTGHYLSPF